MDPAQWNSLNVQKMKQQLRVPGAATRQQNLNLTVGNQFLENLNLPDLWPGRSPPAFFISEGSHKAVVIWVAALV